jgi:glucose-1-phosphate cytidylyltransferase
LKVVLLAGGLGTRLAEETDLRPKPMVELGGMPILWHIMQIYAAHGFTEFVVALGYKQFVIKDWFLQYYSRNNDVSVDLATGQVTVHRRATMDWKVHLVDTGLSTQTGGRLARLRPWLDGTFLMTYGDGVGNIDVGRLVATHRAHGRLATVTAVRPPSRFGGMTLDPSSGKVTEFREKPQTGEGWINGGFFVLEPEVLDHISGDDTPWELEPLERLAAQGDLVAYRHEGFWLPMDSLRDKRTLEAMWESGTAPWKVW